MFAVQNGHIDMVTTFLKAGAEVNAKAKGSATALIAASQFGHNDVVQMF